MLHTIVQASEPSGCEGDLKKKKKKKKNTYFYGLNLEPPGAGPYWTLGPSFEQTW